MSVFSFEKELNPPQRAAVTSTAGAYLVIAGAGSGKTRVLVYRVAHLVQQGVRPEEILLLTFTRKAAAEMLRRASVLLDQRCERVSGGTFHSFAHAILRRYAKVIGIPSSFTIMDQSDAEDTVNLVRQQLGYSKSEKRFPRKKALLEMISKSINCGVSLEDVIDGEFPQFLEWTDDIKKIRNAYAVYKANKGLLDYDDLLVYLRNLLDQHAQVRAALARQYRYIMVDEYQDTNKLQAHIVCLLASEHGNVMVVGDDSQSIYSFRGANFKNIMEFPKLFPGASVITLEENYRSVQPILSLTNEVIRHSREKYEKNLYTRKKGGALPLFVDAEDEHAQSRYVADKVLALREEGMELSEMAVLFRAGWHSNDLEVELASRGIPFMKYGGQKFVEAAHIKDVLAYLRIAYNPLDEVSWLRALLLMRGIGPKTAERVLSSVIGARKGVHADDALIHKHADAEALFMLLRASQSQEAAPAALLERFLEYYQPLLKDKYDDFNKRLNDLDSLVRIAARYHSLEGFLADMALEPPERSLVEAGHRDGDDATLTLSTIHSAKGLEWKAVFVIYVAEGHLPSYLSLESEDAIEEERRLFYVAATRAKEQLYLLKPHIDRSPRAYMSESGSVFTQVSRFLTEGDAFEKLVRLERAGAQGFEEVEWQDMVDLPPQHNKEFLDLMRDYFHSPEEP